MKRTFLVATLMVIAATLMVSCNKSKLDGFKQYESGLMYRMDNSNMSGEKIQEGDMVVGEIAVIFDKDTLSTTFGHPDRLFKVNAPQYKGIDIAEGLLDMRVGETATFAVFADTLAQYMNMPPNYEKGAGQVCYWHVKITDRISADELEQEYENQLNAAEERRVNEPEAIKQYIAEKGIKVAPTASGLYRVVNKMGNGIKVAVGMKVSMDYEGTFFDGNVFDSSKGKKPLEYVVGQMGLIPGWEEGVMGMPAGSDITLVVPSELAYGEKGAGGVIQPYTPLVFNIKINSVEKAQ